MTAAAAGMAAAATGVMAAAAAPGGTFDDSLGKPAGRDGNACERAVKDRVGLGLRLFVIGLGAALHVDVTDEEGIFFFPMSYLVY